MEQERRGEEGTMSKFEVAPRETGEKAAAVKYKQGDFSLLIRPAGREPSRQDCPSKAAGVKMQIYPNRERLNWECQSRDFLQCFPRFAGKAHRDNSNCGRRWPGDTLSWQNLAVFVTRFCRMHNTGVLRSCFQGSGSLLSQIMCSRAEFPVRRA